MGSWSEIHACPKCGGHLLSMGNPLEIGCLDCDYTPRPGPVVDAMRRGVKGTSVGVGD